MEKCPAHPATVENLNFPHKNISGWLKILTCGSHCPQKLWDRSLASAVRHRYGIRNVSSGFAALAAAVGRAGGRGFIAGSSPPQPPPSPTSTLVPWHRAAPRWALELMDEGTWDVGSRSPVSPNTASHPRTRVSLWPSPMPPHRCPGSAEPGRKVGS